MSSRLKPPPSEPPWDELIGLWLHGRPASTQEIYRPVVQDFRLWFRGRPISRAKLPDLQGYVDTFSSQKPRTRGRKISSIRSFTGFLHKTGYLKFDIGRALRTPKIPSDLAERILTQEQIARMVELEECSRNKVLLRVLFGTGIRASEASTLRWQDAQARGKGMGQITVLGKGNKRRSILLSKQTWKALQSIRPENADPKLPVFVSREGSNQSLSRMRISTIVREAAHRAGIDMSVSAHWMRHSHATSALEKGVPLPVIQQTLGHTSINTTSRYLHVRPDQSSATAVGV